MGEVINKDKKYFQIGELANILGIPSSTLRYYDKTSLLVPSIRDKENNYRMYNEEQVLDAANILHLKRMGIPLDTIKLILQQRKLQVLSDNLDTKVRDCRDEIERLKNKYHSLCYHYKQVNKSIELLDHLNMRKILADQAYLIDEENVNQPQGFNIKYVEQQQCAFIRFTNHVMFSEGDIATTLRLNNYIESNHLDICGPLTIIFYDTSNCRFSEGCYEVEMLYPIKPTHLISDNIGTYGGYWTISTLHMGNYDTIENSFIELKEYIKQHGLEIVGNAFEQYLIDFLYINNDNVFLTNVAYPIKKPE